MFISSACIIRIWQWITSFWPWRSGLHSFSSIEKKVIQLFMLNKMVTSFVHWEESYTSFHPSSFHPLRLGLYNFSSIIKRVTSFCLFEKRVAHFHLSNFHPLRRGLQTFSSIEERVTKLFIHWEECYTTSHPSTRQWRCRSWTFEQLATSVNQNMVIGYQKYLSWHSHASAISCKWWPLVGYLVHHCAELHQQYIQNGL